MSTSDPAWLQGLTSSPCSAQIWQDYDQRQFCVLPFYADGDRSEPPRYAMWGRALSNNRFYPVPPSMYRLDLVQCNPDSEGVDWYQWNAQVHGKAPYCVPVEMQKVRAVECGRDEDNDPILDLEVSSVITPEFVEDRWGYDPNFGLTPTDFYPDVSLWSRDLLISTMGDDWFPDLPSPMGDHWVIYPVAPVETHFCPIFKQISIRSSSTRLWDRERSPTA